MSASRVDLPDVEDERGMRLNYADARPLTPLGLNFQRYFATASIAEQKQNFPLDGRNTDGT